MPQKTALKSNLCFHGVNAIACVDAISFYGTTPLKPVFQKQAADICIQCAKITFLGLESTH
jgi:hypothetical protein